MLPVVTMMMMVHRHGVVVVVHHRVPGIRGARIGGKRGEQKSGDAESPENGLDLHNSSQDMEPRHQSSYPVDTAVAKQLHYGS